MFKKIWLFSFFVLFFLGISTHAQTGIQPNWIMIDTWFKAEEPTIQVKAFNGFWVRHCDQWVESDKLSIQSSFTLNSTETKTLCNVFINESDFPITVKYAYVNAGIGEDGRPSCELVGWKFGSFVTTTDPTTFTIPANSNVVKYDKMFVPPGMSGWLIHWCLGYGLESIPLQAGEEVPMFRIETRKVILYDVFVGWESKIENSVSLEQENSENYITNKKLGVAVDKEWKHKVSVIIKNNGNIDQIISITGKVSNFLWFEKEFSLEKRRVGPHQTAKLEFTIGEIPSYKWFFDVKMDISYTPSLAFADFWLSAEALKWGVFNETWMFFVFSWYVVWILVFILLFFWVIIKNILPRKKQVW